MKYLIPLIVCFGIGVFYSLEQHKSAMVEESLSQSSRQPADALDRVFFSFKRITIDNLRAGMESTTEFITAEAVEKFGVLYVKSLDLDPEIEEGINQMLKNDNYVRRMIPFLMMMKDAYTMPDDAKELSFNNYLAKNRSKMEGPGDVHQLFEWQEGSYVKKYGSKEEKEKFEEKKRKEMAESKKDKPSLLTKELIKKVISIYHHIFVEYESGIVATDPEAVMKPYKQMTGTENDLAVLAKVQPIIGNILKDVLGKAAEGAEAATAEAIGGFQAMTTSYEKSLNPQNELNEMEKEAVNRFQALSISLIDFVAMMAHKSYRIYLSKWAMRKNIKHELYERIRIWRSNDGTTGQEAMRDIIAFADYELNRKNYALQIGVDGLQKGLLDALVTTSKPNEFLNQILKDHEELQNLKFSDAEEIGTPEEEQRHEYIEHIVKNGANSNSLYLPYFKKMLLLPTERQGIVEQGISTTPTISVRNLPIIFTGAKPTGDYGTGVPNFHFVDRETDRAYYFFGNDALLLDVLTSDAGMITQFDRMQSLGMQTMNCNAQYDWSANTSLDGLVNLGLGEGIRDFGETLCYANLRDKAKTEKRIRKSLKRLKEYAGDSFNGMWPPDLYLEKLLKEAVDDLVSDIGDGLPEFVLWYNPWPDHFAHFYGPFADAITSPTGELNRLDYWIGKMDSIYSKAGIKSRTLFGMAGDHGLSPIYKYLNPEVVVLEQFEKETGRKVKVKKISSDEGEGPKLNNAIIGNSAENVDVVIASTAGGNYMMDFFLSKSKNSENFLIQPTYSDLSSHNLMSDSKPVDWMYEIATRLKDSLEYLVVRKTQCPRDQNYEQCLEEFQNVLVIGTRKGKLHKEEIIRKMKEGVNYIYYKPSDGDLLGLTKNEIKYNVKARAYQFKYEKAYNKCIVQTDINLENTWCSEKEWRELSSYTDKPGAVSQLAHLYDSDRAGTVNLFPKYGVGYNTKVPGRHAGESYHEKDAFTGVWGRPLISMEKAPRSLENGSVPPTIFEWLSPRGIDKSDGFGYEPIYVFQ